MASVNVLTVPFFDDPYCSDIIIKFGGHQIRAHKAILAQQSGYFATAFFGRFQVASSPIIDLGDEDDSELLTDTIKYLYRHGRVHDVVHGIEYSVSIDALVDIYQLADKYDIPGLRHNAIDELYSLVSTGLQKTTAHNSFKDYFMDCIARVCGPNAVQFADTTIRTIILDLCQEHCLSLFQNKAFLQRYTRGELLDIESATALGIDLGARLLTSNGLPAEEASRARGFLGTTYHHLTEGNVTNLFNDERLSDIVVTYSNEKIWAHKIILVTHSSYFQDLLRCSPTISKIDLGTEHDSVVTTAFLKDMYLVDGIDRRPDRSPIFFAEMSLIAKQHGRHDVADDHIGLCCQVLQPEPSIDEYLSCVAALCGPESLRYADTSLPDRVVMMLLYRVEHMNFGDLEEFKRRLEEGSLLNARCSRRLAAEMLNGFRIGRRNNARLPW